MHTSFPSLYLACSIAGAPAKPCPQAQGFTVACQLISQCLTTRAHALPNSRGDLPPKNDYPYIKLYTMTLDSSGWPLFWVPFGLSLVLCLCSLCSGTMHSTISLVPFSKPSHSGILDGSFHKFGWPKTGTVILLIVTQTVKNSCFQLHLFVSWKPAYYHSDTEPILSECKSIIANLGLWCSCFRSRHGTCGRLETRFRHARGWRMTCITSR